MVNSFIPIFSTSCVFFAAFDFFYSYRAFRKSEPIGRWIGLSAAAAGLIIFSYLLSISIRDYRLFSISSSVYFLLIDWMLIFLLHFVYRFTDLLDLPSSRLIQRVAVAYAVFDTAVLLINTVKEIAVEYVESPSLISHYSYRMKPLYVMHLVFTYLLVVLILGILIWKCCHTPQQYRNQYMLIIAAIVIVVAVNALFLYPDTHEAYTQVDYSILGYSAGLYLMYWAAFDYRKNDMLRSLSMTIYEDIGQGIVLFDFSRKLIMHNHKADQLFSGLTLRDGMRFQDFVELCQIPDEVLDKDQYIIQFQLPVGSLLPVECSFRKLRDRRNRTIGLLFVFADIINENDLLTGFQHWENFHRFAQENPYHFEQPTSVVIFDITGLGHINRIYGRESGNQRIRNLVRLMRRNMPQDATFVRGYEAHLVAVCPGKSEEDVLPLVNTVIGSCSDTVLFGISATASGHAPPKETPLSATAGGGIPSTVIPQDNSDLIRAVDIASRTLQVKKLLSSKSPHSQTVSSLVRALQESDSDTEAHVHRTQKMGAALGRRVGLSDSQLADLNLLCLLHDIGKIGIPLEILNKPGKLTEQEWVVLRSHAEKGYQIAMSSDELRSIAPMILSHHERWDGNGYPEHLSGLRIPVLSRIISVVDAYDAMVNDRAYRKGFSPEAAQEEIRVNAGTQFDPYLAYEFLLMLKENPEIAHGEITGANEVRTFIQTASLAPDTGTTYPIPCSRYMLDLDEKIIEVDGDFEAITGFSAGEVIGRLSQYDLIPEADRPYYMIQVNNQFSKGSFAYLCHNLLRKDGDIIQVVCYGKRYYDSAEKAFRSEILIFPVRDINSIL